MHKSRQGNDKHRMVDLEMVKYIDMEALPMNTDPLHWWWLNGKNMFPILFEAAMKFLIIPATSVPSERVFSSSGAILTKKRTKLDPRNVNILVRLHANLKET